LNDVVLLLQVSLGPNLDTLHLLCSAFGEVAKIAVFEKTTGLQALVQVGLMFLKVSPAVLSSPVLHAWLGWEQQGLQSFMAC
jgi:hypothetical protein